jgi:hypothetical protein
VNDSVKIAVESILKSKMEALAPFGCSRHYIRVLASIELDSWPANERSGIAERSG